jgi:pimeloyl-ACP methyl ester carboxylesterase
MATFRHRTIEIDGQSVAVREIGDPSRPTIVLLPGFPSSSRAYVRLMDRLAPAWHAVAIDYPGFGSSDPLPETPTFDRLAEITGRAIDQLGIADYALYVFDFGAPVGFRIALEHDQRVRAILTQNGNMHVDGLGPGLAAVADWWKDRDAGQQTIDGLLSLAGTQMQWQAGARDVDHVDPAHAMADQAVIDLPGRAGYMQALLWDYQNNLAKYGEWQAWLGRRQPKVIAAWGKNDPFFVSAGAEAYRTEVPDAEVVLLDTGHFALEEEVETIAELTDRLLQAAFQD